MNKIIKLKRSQILGKRPTVNQLSFGELALNYADGKLYYKAADNTIKAFIGSSSDGSIATPIPYVQRYYFNNSIHWIINHNRGTDRFVETMMDNDGNRMYARVVAVDQNTIEVNLTQSTSGYIDVMFFN